MAQGESEGVRLVLRRLFAKGKQEAHHVLNLSLLGSPCTDNGELDRLGTIFVNLYAPFESGAKHCAPCLSDFQGGVGIAGEDQLLHGQLMRPVLRHHLRDTVEDHAQPRGPRVATNPDTAAVDTHAAYAIGVDYPEPGGAGARIDAEYTVAQLGFGLHLFPFVGCNFSAEFAE